MNAPTPRYAMLRQLAGETDSNARRELLRKVTESLSQQSRAPSEAEFAELDGVLSAVAHEYSVQVRTEFARLVAASVSRFCHASEKFALDDAIEVAAPVLRHSRALSEETLLRVVREKSQAHMMAVTQRATVSEGISQALVERGDDEVVASLLSNARALIDDATYDAVAMRAAENRELQAPLVNRAAVPLDLLNGLYQKAEQELRTEILRKFENASPADLEKAFERSRAQVTRNHQQLPEDFAQARKHVAAMKAARQLVPAALVSLLREGQAARTTFKLAFAGLTDVEFDVIDRAVETGDLDTIALLCRGARFDRGLFVSLAVGLDKDNRGLAGAEQFGRLYESVPVEAAQRALRFWKVRAA